jgi:uncharacterized protein (TIGR02301 family)
MKRLAGVVCAAVLAVSAVDASAQQRPRQVPAPTPAPQAPAPEPPETPLAYEPELLRLSETLGVIAFLSRLCEEPEAEDWRRRAQQIIDAEGATQPRKERLAGAFNRGYMGYQAMHRTCTEAARLVIERRREEARRITQDVSTRFGG